MEHLVDVAAPSGEDEAAAQPQDPAAEQAAQQAYEQQLAEHANMQQLHMSHQQQYDMAQQQALPDQQQHYDPHVGHKREAEDADWTLDEEGGSRRGAGKRTRGAGGGYGAGMRARSASGGGRAHKEPADPLREAAVQDEEDNNAIERAQREARIVQLAITYVYQMETGEEARLAAQLMELPSDASVSFLKRRLERISFGGHQLASSQQELHMPVPNHEHATALMTEYTYHGQENRLETYGLEPPGPYEILLKASLQGPAAQEPHTAQAIESGASFMAAVTDATAPMPGMEGDPSQAQQVHLPDGTVMEGHPDGTMGAILDANGQPITGEMATPTGQGTGTGTTKSGKSTTRRSHTRWTEAETMRLIAGVEQHGVGHWKKLQQEQDLGHRSDVDLKDKWRNIVKSVKANKQMRGVVLGPDDIARVQECLRQFEQSKATDGNQPYVADPNQHGMAQMHAGMEAQEQVDPGHMHAAPPLEQAYQHDAIPHHQQLAEQEQYQQLGGYSDEQGQHYAAMYAAQQMGIAQQMAAYDPAAIAAWQQAAQANPAAYAAQYAAYASQGMREDAYNQAPPQEYQQEVQVGQEEVHALPPQLQPPPPVEAGAPADQSVDLNAPPETSMPA